MIIMNLKILSVLILMFLLCIPVSSVFGNYYQFKNIKEWLVPQLIHTFDTIPDTIASNTGQSYNHSDNSDIEQYYYREYYAEQLGRVFSLPGYSGTTGCNMPLDESRLFEIKAYLSNEQFDSRRLRKAKQIVANNCFTVDQIRLLASLFDFEENKLNFLFAAYEHTFDIEHYSKVTDVLDYASSIKALDEYMFRKF